ncbi:MAG TPA: PKD domain-containing protein [Steroidobacteraceae bacterium]|nr:PKD domain-containing protein [Steroidobacteraceae bacterium]
MRACLSGLTLVASLGLLSACGGGGGGGSSSLPPPPPPNVPPTANAGPAQTVDAGVVVTLDGTASQDSDGTIASYAWTQTAGTWVALSSNSSSQPTFTSPCVAAASSLTFSLKVTDDRGATSLASTVNVSLNPLSGGCIAGRVRFVRIPFGATLSSGLDYANPQTRPARGVTVRALASGSGTELARGSTDGNGDYRLTVTPGANVTIEVVAQMVRTGAAPTWNFSVADLGNSATATPPYTFTDGLAFDAGSGVHDVLVPSGFSTTGGVIGTRASAPFAILDTLYQGYQLVLDAAPGAVFPPLVVDWAVDNTVVDGTFFSSAPLQHIVLTADVRRDTDEFDAHVIAHEFGHYIEHNFSRADSIGGTHGIGDKLDPRVAFGEGFGYAFGAMVLDDPVTRDSFVEELPPNSGNFVQRSGVFNVEANPPTLGPGVNGNYGCWCSESSVWSILWDVFDASPDANDTLSLGFKPIWNVLTGAQRSTTAFTTIFSFITALKAQNAGSAAAIDSLVSAQNINSAGIDAFGSNEDHVPADTVPQLAALPIYTTATVGGPPVMLRTVNDAGPDLEGDSGNKLGNHRFVRFTSAGGMRTITATSSNPNNHDVDFKVYRLIPPAQMKLEAIGQDGPAASETESFNSAAAEYLIDVYDCANGCEPVEGTPGDYDLTVTIQ